MTMSMRKIVLLICAALFSLSLAVQASDDKGEMKDQGAAPATEATGAGDMSKDKAKGEMKDEEMKEGEMKEGMQEEKKDMK